MSALLHQLENNEAILLMYLADELPPEDRAEVEQMLAVDPALCAELAQMRELMDGTTDRLDSLDERSPARERMVIRHTVREMTRFQMDLAARPSMDADGPVQRRWSRWAYVGAAVAAGLFILIGMWGAGIVELPGGEIQKTQVANDDDKPDGRGSSIAFAEELAQSFEAPDALRPAEDLAQDMPRRGLWQLDSTAGDNR